MSINISEKKIKSKIKIGERIAVIENIKYPFFESEKNKKLCERMNDFYKSVAEKYSHHARSRLPKRIKLNRISCKLPMTLAMNYTVSLCDERAVSIVLDLVFSEGKSVKTRRFSQLWSVKNQDILPLSELLRPDKKSRKGIYNLVVSRAKENDETGTFGYFGDYLVRLSKHFDIRNCFIVPNGICFFINAGILSPVKYGSANFVLPFSALADTVNEDFLPKEGKKEAQRADIVNNV